MKNSQINDVLVIENIQVYLMFQPLEGLTVILPLFGDCKT